MILAIRAPYGSTLEIPCEARVKEMKTLALKNKISEENMNGLKNNNSDLRDNDEY